jgi:hypothetical protein
MKKTLLAVAITAASFTAIADVQISGHGNIKAGLLEDFQSNGVDGKGNEDLTIGNAGTSKSRFRIKSSLDAGGVKYGFNSEFGINTGSTIDQRVNEVYASGSLGKLSLGQGSIAGDGVTEEDFSGTYLTSGDLGSWELGAGKAAVATPSGDDDQSEVDLSGAGSFEAITASDRTAGLNDNGSKDINRTERLRYDAPMLGNLALSASINDGLENDEGNDIAVAARYALPALRFHVAMISAEADDSDVVAASVAGKLANFTAALGYYTEEQGNDDLEQVHVILGYNPGPFSISVDYQTTELDDNSAFDAETTGLNFVYRPTKGVELYAGARNAEAGDGAIDEDAFLMGARVKF